MSITASWTLPRLVGAIAKAGWDELAGRRGGGYRAVLRALADILPPQSAIGLTTARQIADTAGLSERWARHILVGLEEAGVIVWTRGTIVDGHPTPGLIRVSKRALADLARRARHTGDERLARRAAETAARIRDTLRTRTLLRAQPKRSANAPTQRPAPVPRAELNATLPPSGEGDGATGLRSRPVTGTTINEKPAVGSRRAQLRALRRQREQEADPQTPGRQAVTQ